MKKASAIVLYNGKTNQLYNLTITRNNSNITLVSYFENVAPAPYKYDLFAEMYKAVINIAKQNGFYFGKYTDFGGAVWYDISFIDINNPVKVSRYGLL